MSISFIHLQCHSEYSLVDGLLRIKPWIKKAVELGMPAIALTDQANLFAMIKFYREALANGIKPIIGCDIWLENEQNPTQPFQAILLCQNNTGYNNLTNLISKSYIEGQIADKPIVKKAWLIKLNQGLIMLANARTSDIAQNIIAENEKSAEELITYWNNLFLNRFFLCIAKTKRKNEHIYLKKIIKLVKKTNCPLVATNEVCFLLKEDFEAHEARVCIKDGLILNDPSRPKLYSEEQYLKSPEEMQKLFAEIPAALENTVEIAKRCNLTIELDRVSFPKYHLPEETTIEQYLNKTAQEGLGKRIAHINDLYQKRLYTELEVINKMGFADYFLIVADFIHWARENDIPVGPGRGSGAGSLVAYSLGITDIDPLQYDLLFERFLNPERISLPDFDIDFCMEGRDRVIEYITNKYGKDSVAQIITFGSMAARGVIRDVGRVLGHPYGFVDKIAKLIPMELGITLEKSLSQEETLNELYQKEDEVKILIDLAKKLEGIVRNVGKHAGGVVIAPSALTNYTPLYCDTKEMLITTQFDMNDIAAIGLIKFDFLGLRTLTIIKWTLDTINEQRKKLNKPPLDINNISLQEPEVFQNLATGKTTAIFQLESSSFTDLTKRLQPDCIEDILALVALHRPGPLQSGMVEDFINRKKGLTTITYQHPDLELILKSTYGIIVYQEQVMQIAQTLAGYTLGAADILRKAMGKKNPKEMAKQRAVFTSGSVHHGVDEKIAKYIFDLMEKFAGYGFNKSHSAAYALITYQTAWLKLHYPSAFMAAALSSDMNNTDKLIVLIKECRELGIKITPPDINRSIYKFHSVNKKQILYGLGAIKSVGETAIASILAARENGNFKDLFDFCARVDLRKVTSRVIEALINAGALDALGKHRASLISNISAAIQAAEQMNKNAMRGQMDLFGDLLTEDNIKYQSKEKAVSSWSKQVRLFNEKTALGLYLTDHPIKSYEQELQKMGICKIADLNLNGNKLCKIAGFIYNTRTIKTKRGDRMAFITIDDHSGQQEIAIFTDLFKAHRELLKKDALVIVEGDLSRDDYSGGFRFKAREVMDLDTARANLATGIKLAANQEFITQDYITALMKTLENHPHGMCPVLIHYNTPKAEAKIRLGKNWLCSPSDALLNDLVALSKDVEVEVLY